MFYKSAITEKMNTESIWLYSWYQPTILKTEHKKPKKMFTVS